MRRSTITLIMDIPTLSPTFLNMMVMPDTPSFFFADINPNAAGVAGIKTIEVPISEIILDMII